MAQKDAAGKAIACASTSRRGYERRVRAKICRQSTSMHLELNSFLRSSTQQLLPAPTSCYLPPSRERRLLE